MYSLSEFLAGQHASAPPKSFICWRGCNYMVVRWAPPHPPFLFGAWLVQIILEVLKDIKRLFVWLKWGSKILFWRLNFSQKCVWILFCEIGKKTCEPVLRPCFCVLRFSPTMEGNQWENWINWIYEAYVKLYHENWICEAYVWSFLMKNWICVPHLKFSERIFDIK